MHALLTSHPVSLQQSSLTIYIYLAATCLLCLLLSPFLLFLLPATGAAQEGKRTTLPTPACMHHCTCSLPLPLPLLLHPHLCPTASLHYYSSTPLCCAGTGAAAALPLLPCARLLPWKSTLPSYLLSHLPSRRFTTPAYPTLLYMLPSPLLHTYLHTPHTPHLPLHLSSAPAACRLQHGSAPATAPTPLLPALLSPSFLFTGLLWQATAVPHASALFYLQYLCTSHGRTLPPSRAAFDAIPLSPLTDMAPHAGAARARCRSGINLRCGRHNACCLTSRNAVAIFWQRMVFVARLRSPTAWNGRSPAAAAFPLSPPGTTGGTCAGTPSRCVD